MTSALSIKYFQQQILDWYRLHGRKNLPWQQTKSLYHIWLSEIMLQQTQVATVIPYFNRFINRFPTLYSLAKANLDDVLSLWSGLGYYTRGRNLYRCAQIIESSYAGNFPQNLEQLQTLPGIGRSTAGAILSLGFNQVATILDGNVKRVLMRFHTISGWHGAAIVNKKLWSLATLYTPIKQTANYTQAIMDLGALICTRTQPHCSQCPLKKSCLAYKTGNPTQFPLPKPNKKIPYRNIQMLILFNQQQEILFEKRPPSGIWGGLWSLPECALNENIQQFLKKNYYCEIDKIGQTTQIKHTFSHFHLHIQAIVIQIKKWQPPRIASDRIVWYNVLQITEKGLASPVKKLVLQLSKAKF